MEYEIIFTHKIRFKAKNDEEAEEFWWGWEDPTSNIDVGHLNAEKRIMDHGYVGTNSFTCLDDGRKVEDSIMPNDVWKLVRK